jgi:hypothetical protein
MSSKAYHHTMRESKLIQANVEATIKFTTSTMKKAQQISQYNEFSLFTLEDANYM